MSREKSRLSLWRETTFLRVLNDVANFLLFALRRFIRDGMNQAAAALTYSTLLALVPLLVIVFSVLSGFKAFGTVQVRIEDALFGTLIPEVGVEVRSYFGLTPKRYQSGEHDNPGRISRAGDRDVRATLYAAANALIMRTMAGSQIKSWGMRLIRTKGRRRAVVAVARKLAVLLHRMWIDGTEFRQDQVGGTA